MPYRLPLIAVLFALGCAANPNGPGRGDGGSCLTDDDCPDDGVFCNGRLACSEGRCVAADVPTCSDGIACTTDTCEAASDECVNMPVNSACPEGTACYPGAGCAAMPPCEFDADCGGDGVFCNGDEVCVEASCRSPGAPRSCDDGDSCTADECVEADAECTNTPFTDVLTNPAHCGTGANDCVVCPMPPETGHATATCVEGACGFECMEGWFDADGDPTNFCESDCVSTGAPDDPDDAFADSNCDGIDGDAARAIFVAVTGRDTNPGTMAAPKRTFGAAISEAAARGFDVYASVGEYDLTETLVLSDGVSIYGGYDAAMGWARSDADFVVLNGAPTAVRAENITTPTVVDRIDVNARSTSAAGGASIAVHVVDSPALTFRVSEVRAGDGGNGSPGGDGTRGGDGSRGADAVGGIEYDATISDFCGVACSCGAVRPGTPLGGASACSPGGYGGRGGLHNGSGEAGERASTAAGGPGRGGSTGNPGNAGANGANGGPGSEGAAGAGAGSIVGDGWVPGNGGDGNTGGHGVGGGGGGGGGGDPVTSCCCRTYGDTGASGGGAGCGGTPGLGGGGGGGSIGFLVIRSTLTLERVSIVTGVGGAGGRGGMGGPGGDGAEGGLGSGEAGWMGTRDVDDQGYGGGGGDGGDGGRGGHGGGGAGGPSVGILRTSTSTVTTTSVSTTLGAGGSGGPSPANDGEPGVRMNEVVL